MRDDPMQDDSSHYEISLTAGQAFTAFVLLLLSLAASFAFGVIIGRGGSPQPPPTTPEAKITENATGPSAHAPAVELPVSESASETKTVKEPKAFTPKRSHTAKPTPPAAVPHIAEGSAKPTPPKAPGATSAPVPYFAQILSTREGPAAEALAAKMINDGFKTAYVERVPSDGGMIYRVRVRFPSESAARAAVSRLRGYAPGEIWVTHE